MLRLLGLTRRLVSGVREVPEFQTSRISVSAASRLKEIREIREGQTLTVEGVNVPSPREQYLIKPPHDAEKGLCPLCSLGLDLKHTDVLILSQFLRSDGCMLPKRITGLCNRQQRRVTKMVAMAQKAGLMPNITPSYSHKDPKKRSKWKKFNSYYDETTIVDKLPRLKRN